MNALEIADSRIRQDSSFNEESFQTFLGQRHGEPAWLKAHREVNWQRFQEMPEPSRKEENWRFGDPRRLAIGKCELAGAEIEGGIASTLKETSNLIPAASERIILANDHCIEEADLPAELRNQGVIFESLESALLKRPDDLRPHLEAEECDLGSAKQRALHAAYLRNGAYLRIPAGVVVEQPLLVYHWINGQDIAVFPRTIIEAEENSEVTLVDVYLSTDVESNAFACALGSIQAGTNAKVTRLAVQNWSLGTASYLLDSNRSGRDAHVQGFSILLGSSACRHETSLRITEPGGAVRVRSLVAASGDQLFDQRSRQDHQAEHTTSDLLCKNALLDESRSIFAGLIRVEDNAQYTDAYQTNRNLVIGPTAEAHALPGLEILANDVKCSHGATTGKIDEEQLFYLQSRGIPLQAARQLLTLGFFEEILAETPSELADALRILLRDKLETSRNDSPSSR